MIITLLLLTALIGTGKVSTAGLNLWQDGQVSNYPNPFDSRRESTTIIYRLSGHSEVRVRIFDLFGNVVRDYPQNIVNPGTSKIVWDGTDESGQKVSMGGYLAVVEIENSNARLSSVRKIGVVH